MTTETAKPKLVPQYFPNLGRVIPATQRGTIRWCNGPLVQAATLQKLESWQGRMTAGQMMDRLVAHADKTGFQGDATS